MVGDISLLLMHPSVVHLLIHYVHIVVLKLGALLIYVYFWHLYIMVK